MPDCRRILLVEGDAALRRSLAEQLAQDGEFSTLQCDSAAAALQLAKRERFDAVLLDSALPDMAGHELCRRLRRAGIAVPVLMLTEANGAAAPPPHGGVDDCLVKPFRLNDLLMRLRGRLREQGRGDDAVVTIGHYAFRPGAKLMTDSGGRAVHLTDKEAAILEFLYRSGRVIDRDTLLGEVWGYHAGVTTHTLETHIYRLRQKIERDPAHAEILVTEPGGYRILP